LSVHPWDAWWSRGESFATHGARMSCCNIFKIDLVWPEQVATSVWFPPLVYVIFTGIVATIFVALQILHLSDNIPVFGAFYFTFLTNWALVLETLTTVLLFISTIWAYTVLPNGNTGQKAPLFVRYSVAFWYMIQPISLIVVILYWTLINQFWDPYPIMFSSWWAHLLNWVVLLTSLFASRIPWSFKNCIWGLLFLVAYLVWTLIHFFARIGTNEPCDTYPQEECPIYDEFDWNLPGRTFGIVIASLVAYFIVAGIYTGFFRCRDACDKNQMEETKAENKDPENGA